MMWMKLIACLLTVGLVQCKQWGADEFPNPITHPEKCGRVRGRPSYVCDPDNIINGVDARILDFFLVNMPNDTKCPCSQWSCERPGKNQGYNIMIALVDKLKPIAGVKDSIQDRTGLARIFAYNLLKWRWSGMGNCNETIVIVFSKSDGILLTLADSTARRTLTESKAGYIQTALAHFFREDGDVGKGLHYLVVNYRRVLDGEYHIPVMYADLTAAGTMPYISWSLLVSTILAFLISL